MTVKRAMLLDAPPFTPVFPPALWILIPDLTRYAPGEAAGPAASPAASPGDLLFFDLETTGLSSGAGVAAFLAAFGRLVPGGAAGDLKLEITQYLLLDYPGKEDFLEAALAEFRERAGRAPLTVTYNGKTFDSQILTVQCLMSGKKPPVLFHADLLHPARRLWKRVLPSCSQVEIETAVLGLDRTGDTPGALAPDSWFAFLKTGETAALRGVCDHNVKDIRGLMRLFAALARIAEDPLAAWSVYGYDLENLALHWRKACRQNRKYREERGIEGEIPQTGKSLLALAARRGLPQAALALARDLFRAGEYEAGQGQLRKIAAGDYSPYMKALACRTLAIDAERRLRDLPLALSYSEAALGLDMSSVLPQRLREDLSRRRDRLLEKRAGLARNRSSEVRFMSPRL
jgi:uncharacterized protein YprB with RNaseH-like and TPR domain